MLKRIASKLQRLYYFSSSDRYCKYLRECGIQIGKGCHFDPRSTIIDVSRPSLISIGENCYMNSNFTLLTHDWVTKVFIQSGREFLPSSGKVSIGNNVSFGQNVMILKGSTIGDNCFIGAGSIVTKDIPSNSIAVGAPCRVICNLESYYQKRSVQCVSEALEYARSIKERYLRMPILTDFREEFPLFIDGDKVNQYPELENIIKSQLGPSYGEYIKHHKAKYNGFADFLRAAGL